MAAYVPIDLHRHRSVVMHMADDGEVLGWTRLANDPETLVAEVLKAGEAPEVAIEATYGWYWAVDALQAAGANVHLVAPSKLTAFEGRRVKNDQRDCQVLGDLLRAGMLPEAWISTPQVREWRELVRYRAKLVGMRSGLKAQAHAVLAKHGLAVPMSDLFGVGGRQLLAHLCDDDARFHSAYGQRIESLVVLVDAFTGEIDELSDSIAHLFRDHAGYHAIQAAPRCRPGPGGDLRRRDRRRAPLRLRRPSGLVVRGHAPPPPVRHHRAARPDQQTGLQAGALGSDRSRPEAAPRLVALRRTGTPRRTSQQPLDRQDSDRPQAHHPHLLRPARRRDPLPRASRMTLLESPIRMRTRVFVMTPSPAWSSP